jgi:hypothetical protein
MPVSWTLPTQKLAPCTEIKESSSSCIRQLGYARAPEVLSCSKVVECSFALASGRTHNDEGNELRSRHSAAFY